MLHYSYASFANIMVFIPHPTALSSRLRKCTTWYHHMLISSLRSRLRCQRWKKSLRISCSALSQEYARHENNLTVSKIHARCIALHLPVCPCIVFLAPPSPPRNPSSHLISLPTYHVVQHWRLIAHNLQVLPCDFSRCQKTNYQPDSREVLSADWGEALISGSGEGAGEGEVFFGILMPKSWCIMRCAVAIDFCGRVAGAT